MLFTSKWSTPVPFQTRNITVETPSIVSPINGTMDMSTRPTFICSTMSVGGPTAIHHSSDWMVAKDPMFVQLISSGTFTDDRKISWTITEPITVATIYVRVRHRTDTGLVSEWSATHIYGIDLIDFGTGFVRLGIHDGYHKAISTEAYRTTGKWGSLNHPNLWFSNSYHDGFFNTSRVLDGNELSKGNLSNWALPHLCRSRAEYENEGTYDYYSTGTSVDVYVIDTGIRDDHVELQGKVVHLYSYDDVYYDVNNPIAPSHGTTVAGCVGGNTVGVATGATIYNLRTNFTSSDVVKCLDSVVAHHNEKLANGINRPSIVNMSFGNEPTEWLYSATLAMYELGIVLVACAHNQGREDHMAPAIHPHVISVGSINRFSILSSFSNWGATVDVCAPGEALRSCTVSSTHSYTNSANGTSFSAPYVAGILATIASGKTITNSDHVAWLKQLFLETCKPDIERTLNGRVVNRSAFSKHPMTRPEIKEWVVPEIFQYAKSLSADAYVPAMSELQWVADTLAGTDVTGEWWSSSINSESTAEAFDLQSRFVAIRSRILTLKCLVMKRIPV